MDIAKLKAELETATTRANSLEEQVNTLKADATTNQEALETVKSEKATLEATNTTLTEANTKLTEEVETLKTANGGDSDKVVSLTEANTKLTEEAETLKTSQADFDEKVTKSAQTQLVELAAKAGVPLEDGETEQEQKEGGSENSEKKGFDKLLSATKVD